MLSLIAFLFLFADEKSPSPLEESLKNFIGLFSAVEENAADPINSADAIYEGALPGMLKRLDPHSIFFNPGHFEQLKEMENSTRKGFGTIVSVLPGRVIVLQATPGTPSAKAGLSPGDEIVAVNNIPLARLEMEQIMGLLQESRQKQAKLDVRRIGNVRLLPLLLTPEEMDAPSVERAFYLKPNVAYLRIGSFDLATGQQIRDAIEKLGGDKLQGLVLDLRNNPGGVLNAAVETAGLFLEPGQKIVSVKGRSVKGSDAVVPQDARPYRFPVAVLINGKSASASEIVAGALQDHKRAQILGEPSYGKGLVQSVIPLPQGTAMALTTAFYYTPSGRSIQRKLEGQLAQTTAGVQAGGIQPDQLVYGEVPSRLRMVMDATGSFANFATEFLRVKGAITPEFQVDNAILDQFQTALAARNIQPGISDWSADRDWIRHRLRQEIFNQALGVEKGDEIEAQLDPVVLAALRGIL